jgi:hypothetical protein
MKPETIKIDNVEYVRADKRNTQKESTDGMRYVIVRGKDSGAFAGFYQADINGEVTLLQSRRLWYWEGAASLSQLATDGTSNPSGCKFPCEVDEHLIKDAIEVIYCTEKAYESIKGVPVWEA